MAITLVTMVAATWPDSTAPRDTSMTLKRLMTPLAMSEFTETAVPESP